MTYNPSIHHRRSIRLKGYNYSQAGLYFITICCNDRACLFGQIHNGIMILNDAGSTAQQCWVKIPAHFQNIVLHEFIVMPNHIHGILEIVGANNHSPDIHSPEQLTQYVPSFDNKAKNISPLRSPSQTIGSVVRGFKIGVTKWMRQNTNVHIVWQRNYYEHIIRDEQSFLKISEYILNNPKNWGNDSLK
jgi:putative transposase